MSDQGQTSDALMVVLLEIQKDIGELKGQMHQPGACPPLEGMQSRVRSLENSRAKLMGVFAGVGLVSGGIGSLLARLWP